MAVIAFALPLMAGCEGSTDPVPEAAVGVYQLAAVDGRALPAPLGPATASSLTALRGTLELRRDGEYLQVIETRYVDEEGITRSGVNAARGDFSAQGGRIELRETLGDAREARLDDGMLRYTIRVASQGVTLDWRK